MSISISSTAASAAPLPDASVGSSCSGLSPEERLLALVVYSQASQMDGTKTSVNLNAEQLEKLREQVRKALDEAREAKKDSGFWGGLSKLLGGDAASIASAVAAVAAVIATGGAAAAVLAVVAAAATMAAEHAKELGIPENVAIAIAVTAAVAGLCCGDGAALFKVGTDVKDVASTVKVIGQASAATFKAEGAGCGIVAGKYERDAGNHQADARWADGQKDLVSADIDESLDRLAAALDHQSSAAAVTSNIQQQSSASSSAILNNWGGAA